MKLWIAFLCLLFAVVNMARAQAPKGPAEDSDFVEARRLFWSGQYSESEKMFQEYLEGHPNHEATRSFLQMIAQSRIYNPTKIDETRVRLGQIRIPKVEFRDAEWKKVIAYLQSAANPKVDGKDPEKFINFISMLPSNYSSKITVNLQNVTLLEAIDKITQPVGLRFVIDTYAVIIDLPEVRK